ncbi:MFS transporter [Glutamicibacter protophormiae]|uniref:MFS transporter n=1 Tax=unclassified Kocuria TaxID=2649579 RepID=UPI000F88152E|nr:MULTISPECIES: MFS transporter [unclassified Kocuria]RUP84710.1 MFS transporter [Kocuria sp. HSID17590]RUQ09475.1 MFS transporter [Kocuria sp. HSID17582]WNB90075.1 MFS transporter [Glutamicibacter protophormiae]
MNHPEKTPDLASGAGAESAASTPAGRPATGVNPRRAVPVLLFLFIFCLVVDQGFKFTSQPMAAALSLSESTVSLQATLTGVLIGIGAVVYSALADSVAIRKLLYLSIGLIVVGSVIGFVGSASFGVVLVGRVVQTAGLAAAETLYVVYVTKHFQGVELKKYLGFSNMSFQLASLIGTLVSGFLATYVSWTWMFLIPLLIVLSLPFIRTRVPDDVAHTSSGVDVYGLFLVGVIATGLIMFMQDFTWWWIPVVVATVLFVHHVRTNSRALVDASFFTNRPYISALVIVFIIYSVNLAFVFLFPFAIHGVHGMAMDKVSLLTIPGYVLGASTAAMSGAVSRRLDSKQAVTLALCLLALALAVAGVFINVSVVAMVVAMAMFSVGFGLLYAPLMSSALLLMPAAKSGVAVGFYNLVINVASPIGVAYTAMLMSSKPTWFAGLSVGGSAEGDYFSTILWFLVGITLVGLVVYRVLFGLIERNNAKAAERLTAQQ